VADCSAFDKNELFGDHRRQPLLSIELGLTALNVECFEQ
jgi:hypothetical protein